MPMTDKCFEILSFWFGDHFNHGMPRETRNALWFGFNTEVDWQISQLFGDDVKNAAAGDYDSWKTSAQGRLALIVLLDQFTRNIYRGSREAFAHDELATQLCLEGLELGHDRQLMPAYRAFYYLPLEHNESLQLQQRCVALFTSFYKEADPAIAKAIKSSLAYARQHFEIIERFGRFPHRNAVLGRRSTPAELSYLKQTTINFGQGG